VRQLRELANGRRLVVVDCLPGDYIAQGKAAGFSCPAATAALGVAAETPS